MIEWDDTRGLFVVNSFDLASSVLRGPGWSSDPALSPLAPPEAAEMPTGLMLFRDPPDHTRLRRLVAPAFSARNIEGLRERVAAIVESCLDGMAEETDLLEDYGYLVPMAVIAELLDVGVEGAQVFLDRTPDLVRLLEVDATEEDVTVATAAGLEVTMFLTPILSERRAAGAEGTDFISALLATELSIDEVLSTCVLLLAAGHETTANLIGNGARALLEDPSQQAKLRADPAAGVEELLRFHGPVKLIGRTAIQDHELGGETVKAGQMVLLKIDEIDRDPARWPDADVLDLARDAKSHLALGTGIHFCLGAALARLEGAEALTRLFDAYPDLSLVDDKPAWRESSTFHGLKSLPVNLNL